MNLNDSDKSKIIELIKACEKLPKEFIYKRLKQKVVFTKIKNDDLD